MKPLISEQLQQNLSDLMVGLALVDTATVYRETLVDDGQGGSIRTFPLVLTTPCAIADAGTVDEKLIASQVVGESRKMLLFPRGTVIKSSDVIKVNGYQYRVIEPVEPSTVEVLHRVQCWRLTIPQEDLA